MVSLSSALLELVVRDVAGAMRITSFAPEGQASWPKRVACAQIGFSGPVEGELRVFAGAPALPFLAADVLGVSAKDAAAAVLGEEALAELANVLLGALLRRWFESNTSYHVGLPDLRRLTGKEPPRPGMREGFCAITLIDERQHPLAVVVEFRSLR